MPCLISYSEFQTDTKAENLYDLKKMYLQKYCLLGLNIQTIKSRGSQMGDEDVLRCLSGGVLRGRVCVVYIIYVLR